MLAVLLHQMALQWHQYMEMIDSTFRSYDIHTDHDTVHILTIASFQQ